MPELLLAEPEANIRGFLERQLRSDGFDVLAYPSAGAVPRSARADVLVLGEPDALDVMRVPDCPVIDRAACRLIARWREVQLSQKEFAFLVKLASEPDHVFSREQLLRDVWGYRVWAPTRTVESHASRVRCKLAAVGLGGWIVNAW